MVYTLPKAPVMVGAERVHRETLLRENCRDRHVWRAAAGTASADTLELKDGRLLQGRFLGGTQAVLRFEWSGEVKTFSVNDIVALTFTSNYHEQGIAPPPPAPPPTQDNNAPPSQQNDPQAMLVLFLTPQRRLPLQPTLHRRAELRWSTRRRLRPRPVPR